MTAPRRTPAVAGLEAWGLSAGYPGRPVLEGLSLRVLPGEVLAVIGPNGAGKSTLLKALAGELRPLAGTVVVDDGEGAREASALTSAERARVLARVLQSEAPAWPLPVRDYVAAGTFAATGWFGTPGQAERLAVEESLSSMDLLEFADRPVTELSGGELRRVLIARALAQRPAILLLDEPTADLDLSRQMETLGTLRALAGEGRAVAFTVHDLNLAALAADRIALVSGGRLAALGTPREVMTPEAIGRAYGAEVIVGDHPAAGTPHVFAMPAWTLQREDREHA